MKTKIRAGDDPGKKITTTNFPLSLKALYDVFLYLVLPVGLELSYVKFIKRGYTAFELCDIELMVTFLSYLTTSLLLAKLVKKGYITMTLKKLTLTFLVFLQLREAFFEDLLIDTSIAMLMDSSLIMLLFFKLGVFLLGLFTIILQLQDCYVSLEITCKEPGLQKWVSGIVKPALNASICSHYCMNDMHWQDHREARMDRWRNGRSSPGF